MTINNRIEGTIRLTTALHCANPDQSVWSDKSNDNRTPTMQMRLVTPDGMQTIPYFPGNDLRGRLRRKAAALVLDHVTSQRKVKMELYAGLNCGAISASPESDVTVEEVLRARENVYMGLFGGGTRLLRSRYRVSDMVPILASTIAAGMVPEQYGAEDNGCFVPTYRSEDGSKAVQGWQLLQMTQVLRIDDVGSAARPNELLSYITDIDSVVQHQTDTLNAQMKRKADKAAVKAGSMKAADVAGKTGVRNIVSYQSIMAGTPMYFDLDFTDDVSDAHVGFMILALQALVREQALGGWVRAGLGRFTADLSLIHGGERISVFNAKGAAADATLSDGVNVFVQEAKKKLAGLTADEMMLFFAPRGEAVAAEVA